MKQKWLRCASSKWLPNSACRAGAEAVSVSTVSNRKLSTSDENEERGNWGSKTEFLLSCLSYAIGLGNVWRFPYLVYRNGGGAFLIPYFLMLIIAGLPLFFFELAFGQYASEGPITIWKISPLFQGLGYGMFIVSFLVGIYYNMIIGWTWYYLFNSFTDVLPWNSCGNYWNTDACRRFEVSNCTAATGFKLLNGTCIERGDKSDEDWKIFKANSSKPKMPTDEYFHNYMLSISTGVHDVGGVKLELALCLLLAWVVCFIALLKGVKSFGKAVYFTAFFPYVVLIILLIRAATLPGYLDGILYYVTPQWDKLLTAQIWGDAAVQIFFSLAPCWGGLITLASYNKFHNNCFRDAILVGIVNPLTSFFAGFVIFGIVGFMARELGLSVDEVVGQGAGLAFVAYPEAVTRLPLSPVWAILFFIMLLTLGIGTEFTILETVVTTIIDTWPEKLRRHHKWVLLLVCTIMYLLGLSLCTNGGMFLFQLMDNFCASYSTLFIGVLEVSVISWVYGVDRFMDDIRLMLGHYPPLFMYWKICWMFITPIALFFILIFNIIDFTPIKYQDYTYPSWSVGIGSLFAITSVLAIPAVAAVKISKAKGTFWERIKKLSKPTEFWGPKLAVHRDDSHRMNLKDSQIPFADPIADNFDSDVFYVVQNEKVIIT
uniref:Transporter n=1 Tax=Strigamia maritima TaxID=126957 RepID=T1J3F9_STRMM